MGYPVQGAKVQPPVLRDDTLARPRLLDWLHAKIHNRIVLITAEAGYGLPLPGDGELALRGGAYWRDSTLNTYLYGVLPGEEREDRPAYRVGNGFTPFAGAMVSYPVKGNLRANVAVEAQFLSSEAADSPIIARKVVPSALFGLFYVF